MSRCWPKVGLDFDNLYNTVACFTTQFLLKKDEGIFSSNLSVPCVCVLLLICTASAQHQQNLTMLMLFIRCFLLIIIPSFFSSSFFFLLKDVICLFIVH